MILPPPEPVDEVEAISADAFRADYVEAHRPVIVRGAMRGTPAMAWSDAALAERLRGLRFTVDVMPPGADGRPDLHRARSVEMDVDRFIEALDDAGRYPYILNQPLPARLRPDLPTPGWSACLPPGEMTLWWGRDGQRSSLHLDDNENLMYQCAGYKEFVLFDITDIEHVYPQPDEPGDTSTADLDRLDADRHGLLSRATPYLARIGPGDVLYVPCYWWHQVWSYGRNLAVSCLITESRAQRIRVARRLLDAGALTTPDAAGEIEALRAILCADAPPLIQLKRLRRHHAQYRRAQGRSYYRHAIAERLIDTPQSHIIRRTAYH